MNYFLFFLCFAGSFLYVYSFFFIRSLSAKLLYKHLQTPHVFLDLRDKKDQKSFPLRCKHVPYHQIQEKVKRVLPPPEDKRILFFASSRFKALKAQGILKALGYPQQSLFNLSTYYDIPQPVRVHLLPQKED